MRECRKAIHHEQDVCTRVYSTERTVWIKTQEECITCHPQGASTRLKLYPVQFCNKLLIYSNAQKVSNLESNIL